MRVATETVSLKQRFNLLDKEGITLGNGRCVIRIKAGQRHERNDDGS
jgi:hypothetical protein